MEARTNKQTAEQEFITWDPMVEPILSNTYLTFGQEVNVSGPWFPHLQSGDDYRDLPGLLQGLNDLRKHFVNLESTKINSFPNWYLIYTMKIRFTGGPESHF